MRWKSWFFPASGFSRYSPNRGESSEVFEGIGIHITGSYNTIEKCDISKSWGDGVFIDGHHNRISNCRIEDCDWMGIDCSPLFIGGENQLVDHCDFSKAGRSVLVHYFKKSKILFNKIFFIYLFATLSTLGFSKYLNNSTNIMLFLV